MKKNKKALLIVKTVLISLAIGSSSFAAETEKTRTEKLTVKASGTESYCSGSIFRFCGSYTGSVEDAERAARKELEENALVACEKRGGKVADEDLKRKWKAECFGGMSAAHCSITARISCIVPEQKTPVVSAPSKNGAEVVTTLDGRRFILADDGAHEIRSGSAGSAQ